MLLFWILEPSSPTPGSAPALCQTCQIVAQTLSYSFSSSDLGGIGDQVLGTMLLLLCICAITDRRNMQVKIVRNDGKFLHSNFACVVASASLSITDLDSETANINRSTLNFVIGSFSNWSCKCSLIILLLQVSKQLVPLFVGFTVVAIGICFGFNCGYAINPARDFAPRVFTGGFVISQQ